MRRVTAAVAALSVVVVLSGCGGGPDPKDARAECGIALALNGAPFKGDDLIQSSYGDGYEYKYDGQRVCLATPDGDGWKIEYTGPK